MSMIAVRVDPAGLRKLDAQIDAIKSKIPKAISTGLNDGGKRVQVQVQRALKQQTNVKLYSSITKRTSAIMASPALMSYQIVVKGAGIPIKEFPVKLTLRGVDAQTWGVDHLFARSFGIAGQGVNGYRARRGSTRFPIQRLNGPALPKELTKGIIPTVFVLASGEFVMPAIMRQLARVL